MTSTSDSSSDSENDWYVRQRQALAGLARIRGLPDGVFSIVAYNEGLGGRTSGPGQIAIDPYSVFSDEPRETVEMWVQRSNRLLTSNYSVGNALVCRHPDYARLKGRFVAENPGFSQDTYDHAIHSGAAGAR